MADKTITDNEDQQIESTANTTSSPIYCLPGNRLCLADENTISSFGTYERNGYIYATLMGEVKVRNEDKTKYIEVKCHKNQTIVPVAGDIVTTRITQVNHRFAKCEIICIADYILERNYRAILRREDVRATEKDRIDMYKCYQPGDIILARVLPQTELSCYQLSTAENELGVVVALRHEAGSHGIPMIPISWTEMQCPNTSIKEPRKVAKVVPESALITKKEIE